MSEKNYEWNFRNFQGPGRESNLEPLDLQSSMLPLSYLDLRLAIFPYIFLFWND